MVLSAVKCSATHMSEPEQSGTRALLDRGANGIKHTRQYGPRCDLLLITVL